MAETGANLAGKGAKGAGAEDKYIRLFRQLYRKAESGEIEKKEGSVKRKGYYIVSEQSRGGAFFSCIVPEGRLEEYRAVSGSGHEALLGFSVLVQKEGEDKIRVGCFGISNARLLKSLANATKRSWSYRFMKKRMKSQKRGYGI